jgi:hypothetical protein
MPLIIAWPTIVRYVDLQAAQRSLNCAHPHASADHGQPAYWVSEMHTTDSV